MRFVKDPGLEALRLEAADWAAKVIAPVATELDARDIYPLEIVKDAAGHGYTALALPTEYGGGGKGMTEAAVLFEEVGKASAGVGISLITIFQAQTMLLIYGNEQLRTEVLPRFSDGLITAYALTESKHGSDITSLDTKAVRTPEGWCLNGEKAFITSGSAAEVFVILAETSRGVSTFMLERDRPGVTVYVGQRSATIGLRNGPHMDMRLENVMIPEHYLVGEEGMGVRQALTVLNHSRVLAASISIGIAESAFADSLAWVKNRVAFGKTLFDFQGLQWKFADVRTSIDAARLLVQRAASVHDAGEAAIAESSMAKLFAAEAATRCALEAIQVTGAYGVSENAPFGRYLRDAKAYEIGGGSSEILRNTIARDIGKKHRPAP